MGSRSSRGAGQLPGASPTGGEVHVFLFYLHPIDSAEFLIRQAEEAEADSKTQDRVTGIHWLRNTSELEGLELSLGSSLMASAFGRKNGSDPDPDQSRKYIGTILSVTAALECDYL